MWKLHRYYLKELAINAAITFLVLFAVVLISSVPQVIRRTQGGGLFDAMLTVVLFAIDVIPHLLAIAFLLATVLTFARASQDRELIAVRAAGLAPTVPLTSAVLLGILLSVVGSFTLHYVIPDVHFRKYRVIADAVRNIFLNMNLDSDRIKLPGSSIVMTYRRRESSDFLDCTVYSPRPLEGLKSPIVRVDRISMPDFDAKTDDLSILLEGVHDPIGDTFSAGLPISLSQQDVASRGRREDRDDDLRSDQLMAEVLRGVHAKPNEAIYTLLRRCCYAVLPALLAPIGFCIAELARDRGRVLALVMALVPLALFYLGDVLGARLLMTTGSPWSGWMPAAPLVVLGLPLCWRHLRR